MFQVTDVDPSNFVKGVDTAFAVIMGISFLLLIVITVVMIYFIVRYRKRRNPKATQISGSTSLEILWTIIPTVLVLVMFYFGWAGWRPMKDIPDDARRVKSIARMWIFNFEYENGKRTDTLYVPEGEPVVLDLQSLDVIHSLYIPAFRVKEDMVPGREKQMWFTPTKAGTYDIFCAEYCGLQHSYMYTSVVVMPPDDFERWYEDTTAVAVAMAEDAKPGERGFQIMRLNGCNACHSSDGSKLVGPSYAGLWNQPRVVITDGDEREVIGDEDYIIKSIYEPNADVVKGYNRGLMLSYRDLLSDDDIAEIIEYMKSLEN
jgi:cytochrome c oxidase subunit 2